MTSSDNMVSGVGCDKVIQLYSHKWSENNLATLVRIKPDSDNSTISTKMNYDEAELFCRKRLCPLITSKLSHMSSNDANKSAIEVENSLDTSLTTHNKDNHVKCHLISLHSLTDVTKLMSFLIPLTKYHVWIGGVIRKLSLPLIDNSLHGRTKMVNKMAYMLLWSDASLSNFHNFKLPLKSMIDDLKFIYSFMFTMNSPKLNVYMIEVLNTLEVSMVKHIGGGGQLTSNVSSSVSCVHCPFSKPVHSLTLIFLFQNRTYYIKKIHNENRIQNLIDIASRIFPFGGSFYMSVNGKPLNPNHTLTEANIKNYSTIHLLPRLRGGMDSGSTSPDPAAHNIRHVALKLPPYWPKDPTLWFAQVEAQFTIAKITKEETRFHHVVASLSSEAAAEVRDLILNPPSQPYTTLKDTLIHRTTESATQRLQKALASTEIGDAKPTQVLRMLQQQLDGMEPPDNMLKQVFLQKLPVTVRSIVAANSDVMDITQIAELADRVYEHLPSSSSQSVASATSSTSSNALEDRISRIESMLQRVCNISTKPNTSRKYSRSRSRGRFDPDGKFCYYHWRFRNNATKCKSPCAWKTLENKKPQAKNDDGK